MNCPRALRMIDAYADAELDVATALDLEDHFGECAECSWELESRRSVRAALQGLRPLPVAPGALASRIGDALRSNTGSEPDRVMSAFRARSAAPMRAWLAAAAMLVIGLAVGAVSVGVLGVSHSADETRDVVESHVRSLMADHLMDVASTDKHTVKPWFDGKVPFAPPVNDFVDDGYPLVGGRLDYVDGAPVAALVYQRARHVINLFVRPSRAIRPDETSVVDGYNVVTWTSGGMDFWAVSDLNQQELQALAAMVRAHADPSTRR